jgi:hypothetical protein
MKLFYSFIKQSHHSLAIIGSMALILQTLQFWGWDYEIPPQAQCYPASFIAMVVILMIIERYDS